LDRSEVRLSTLLLRTDPDTTIPGVGDPLLEPAGEVRLDVEPGTGERVRESAAVCAAEETAAATSGCWIAPNFLARAAARSSSILRSVEGGPMDGRPGRELAPLDRGSEGAAEDLAVMAGPAGMGGKPTGRVERGPAGINS
jgi:hypothetical protein